MECHQPYLHYKPGSSRTNPYTWLAGSKPTIIKCKETKIFIVFHAINKATDGLFSELHIDGINIERVTSFNFLGIHFNEHMLWKTHIDTIGCKLAKLSGVLNRLERYLPEYVLRTLYCSMVQSRLTYGILAWVFLPLPSWKNTKSNHKDYIA